MNGMGRDELVRGDPIEIVAKDRLLHDKCDFNSSRT